MAGEQEQSLGPRGVRVHSQGPSETSGMLLLVALVALLGLAVALFV
jgi:hypothetical protein